jgi:hypothetical protein
MRVNDFVARHADSAQVPQWLVAENIWVLKMVHVLGVVLAARLADAAGSIKNKLPLCAPYLRAQVSLVDRPPLTRVLASRAGVQATGILSVFFDQRLVLSRHLRL